MRAASARTQVLPDPAGALITDTSRPSVSAASAAAAWSSRSPVLTQIELARAAQKAVALAQQEKSAWTRADVIKYLGRVLPGPGWTRPRPPRSWKT